MEEVVAVPKQVNGPCLLNVVRGGKSPEVEFESVKDMGYRIAIVPGLLFVQVIGACEQALAAMKAEDRHPVPLADLSPAQVFAKVGANEWEPRREKYREAPAQAAE